MRQHHVQRRLVEERVETPSSSSWRSAVKVLHRAAQPLDGEVVGGARVLWSSPRRGHMLREQEHQEMFQRNSFGGHLPYHSYVEQ